MFQHFIGQIGGTLSPTIVVLHPTSFNYTISNNNSNSNIIIIINNSANISKFTKVVVFGECATKTKAGTRGGCHFRPQSQIGPENLQHLQINNPQLHHPG